MEAICGSGQAIRKDYEKPVSKEAFEVQQREVPVAVALEAC